LNLLDALEYPLPVLNVSVDKVNIENDSLEKSFTIRNTGGGTLNGNIISHNNAVYFSPNTWETNKIEIRCKIRNDVQLKPGEVYSFSATIISNGGSFVLPITVRLKKAALITKDGIIIANIKEFYDYYEKSPENALNIFAGDKFATLLNAINFAYIDAYNLLVKEENKERALDNFFILAGIKEQTTLIIPQKEVEHSAIDSAMIHGNFTLQKSDNGYLEGSFALKHNANWLTLSSHHFNSTDFDKNNTAVINYRIDPLLISKRYEREQILIETCAEQENVNIVFKRTMPLTVQLKKEGYTFNDNGEILLRNNSADSMIIQLFCKDTFVKFVQSDYKLASGGKLLVPFSIKLSITQSAQIMFRRVPFLRTNLQIICIHKGKKIEKLLPITAGEI